MLWRITGRKQHRRPVVASRARRLPGSPRRPPAGRRAGTASAGWRSRRAWSPWSGSRGALSASDEIGRPEMTMIGICGRCWRTIRMVSNPSIPGMKMSRNNRSKSPVWHNARPFRPSSAVTTLWPARSSNRRTVSLDRRIVIHDQYSCQSKKFSGRCWNQINGRLRVMPNRLVPATTSSAGMWRLRVERRIKTSAIRMLPGRQMTSAAAARDSPAPGSACGEAAGISCSDIPDSATESGRVR